jgi:hypothetical protein
MKAVAKYFIVGFLSIISGIAFAYPLYYTGYVENIIPVGPKPELVMKVVYANFTLKPYNNTTPIPSWYNATIFGPPSFLTSNVIINVTNYSNRTVVASNFLVNVCNSTTTFGSVFQSYGFNEIVEGLWLDGKWVNMTWIPQENGVPEHWRQGVDIKTTFLLGNLTSVSMCLNGSWTDVTNRVKLLEKDTVMFMNEIPFCQDFISSHEVYFYDSKKGQHALNVDLIQTNVDLSAGFSNSWYPGQSRLILVKGFSLVSPIMHAHVPEYLNSNITLFVMMAITRFANSNFNGVQYQTVNNECNLEPIGLETIADGTRVYNQVVLSNQVIHLDSFGVEVFLAPRS